MKNTSRSHRFKPSKPLLLGVLLVVFLGSVAFALEKAHVTDFIKSPANDTGKTSGPTAEQKAAQAKADAQAKQDYLDSVTKTDNATDSSPAPDTPSAQQTSGSLTLTASQDGSSVTVLTQIQSIADGTCKLTATKGGSSTSQTAQIIYAPQFSSCAGFSVPVNSIGSGSWSITVTVSPTNGDAITKSTTLEVN